MPSVDYEPADLEILASLEPRHFWFRARRRIVVDALARWFPDARSYLEIGCGTGYIVEGIAEAFPALRVVASDALREGRPDWRGHEVPFLQLDARRIPFDNEFDVIGAYDVLEHIADHAGVLRQFWKAGRPGGGILLTVPQHAWLWSVTDDLAHHHRRYSERDLRSVVEESGFRVIGCSSFNTLNLPFLLIRNSLLQATGRSPRANAPAAPANRLPERLMDMDRLLIRAGVHLRAGGSLLLAARRRE